MNRPRRNQPVQFRLDSDSPWQGGVYVGLIPDARCRVFAEDGTLLTVRRSDIRWRTLTDERVNQYAMFFPANPGDTVPEINLGGDEDGESAVMVRAYADEGVLVVAIDTTAAGPDEHGGGPWAYYGSDQVPVVVTVNGPRVWMATAGANAGRETITEAVYAAYQNGWNDRGHFRHPGDEPVVFAEVPADPGHVHGSDVGPGREVRYADLPDTPAWLAYAGVPLGLVPEHLRESVRAHREDVRDAETVTITREQFREALRGNTLDADDLFDTLPGSRAEGGNQS